MSFVFGGYFPKRIATKPDWLAAAEVEEIWSASTCISNGPEGWLQQWRHNAFGLYDSVALAESVVPPEERAGFVIVGYRIWETEYDQGRARPARIPELAAEEPGTDFQVIGYDAVSSTLGNGFECSPLSCNRGAETMKVNKRCLFDTLDDALQGAQEFSKAGWEPGPYYVAEVLARESPSNERHQPR